MVGLPVLTTDAGALPEQLGRTEDASSSKLAGVLVEASDDDATVIERFSRQLVRMLSEPERRHSLATQSRHLGALIPDYRQLLAGLVDEIERARPWPADRFPAPDPSAAFAVQNLLAETGRQFGLA